MCTAGGGSGGKGGRPAARNLNQFFLQRVRSRLHIVLSMDPTHPQFAVRTESNPAILSRCTIMWVGRYVVYIYMPSQ